MYQISTATFCILAEVLIACIQEHDFIHLFNSNNCLDGLNILRVHNVRTDFLQVGVQEHTWRKCIGNMFTNHQSKTILLDAAVQIKSLARSIESTRRQQRNNPEQGFHQVNPLACRLSSADKACEEVAMVSLHVGEQPRASAGHM